MSDQFGKQWRSARAGMRAGIYVITPLAGAVVGVVVGNAIIHRVRTSIFH